MFSVSISTNKSPSLYGLASVTDISFKSFVYLLHLIGSYHTIFTVGSYPKINSLNIMPHYAEFILAFSVNLTIEDLGLLDTPCRQICRQMLGSRYYTKRSVKIQSAKITLYTPYGNRTHVTAVKRQCLNPLTNGACSRVPYLSQIPSIQTFVA